jgi:hypothetical protein
MHDSKATTGKFLSIAFLTSELYLIMVDLLRELVVYLRMPSIRKEQGGHSRHVRKGGNGQRVFEE